MRVAPYTRLVRLRIRMTAVRRTEVHVHIRQVLQHDRIVLRCQLTDDLQFLLRQTRPGRVVRVAVQNTCDTTAHQVPLQLVLQLRTAVVRDIKRIDPATYHAALHLLHRETWIQKQDRVAFRVQLDQHHVQRKSRLHRTHRRQDTLRRTLQTDESANELRTPFLHFGYADDVRIMRRTTLQQGLMLRLDSDLRSRQPRFTQRHVHVLHTRRLLDVLHHARQLTDTRVA